jgi:hypothetical protein
MRSILILRYTQEEMAHTEELHGIQNKNKFDNIVFTCAFLHSILLDIDGWNDSDDDYDIDNANAARSLDPRIENLRICRADRNYVGGGKLLDGDV